jgi:thioredoxin reductase (NADPH)
MTENVIIIGGGPAGFSAAIYLARAGLKPLVFGGSPPGGQLSLTSEVENFPGQPSILGPELIQTMRDQAKKFGARIVDENVIKVDFTRKPFKIYGNWKIGMEAGQENRSKKLDLNTLPNPISNFISTKSVIIATGAKALWLNVPGEEKLRGKGVSACATCDGFFFKDKTVAVVGGGDTALEEALTLTKFAKKIYLIHRRDSFRASKIMQERVFANKKIKIIWNAVVEEIIGKDRVEGIKIKKLENPPSTDQLPNPHPYLPSIIQLNGVFVAIGHKPDTEIFARQVELDEKGYIYVSNRIAIEYIKNQKSPSDSEGKNTNQNSKIFNIEKYNFDYQYQTSVSGVFAAGDCVDNKYRQAAVAAGMGVSAALEVEKWLEIIS